MGGRVGGGSGAEEEEEDRFKFWRRGSSMAYFLLESCFHVFRLSLGSPPSLSPSPDPESCPAPATRESLPSLHSE